MEYTKRMTLNCDIDKLWDWLTEFEHLKKWNPSMIKQEDISTGEVRKGFKSKMLMQEGKKEVWYEDEMMEYNPKSTFSVALKGGDLGKAPMYLSYKLTPNGDQVDMLHHCEWQPEGFFLRLFQPFISVMAKNEMKKSFDRLKEMVEA